MEPRLAGAVSAIIVTRCQTVDKRVNTAPCGHGSQSRASEPRPQEAETTKVSKSRLKGGCSQDWPPYKSHAAVGSPRRMGPMMMK
jgi:hypothetical protein